MMTKQELLTKLAIECATWGEARHNMVNYFLAMGDVPCGHELEEHDWLADRERLLNLQWDGVPKRYKFVAMHGDGRRWFFVNPPTLWEDRGLWELASGDGYHDYWEDENPPLAIPAGYDWKESLEERPV